MIQATAGAAPAEIRNSVLEIADICTRLRDRIKVIVDDLPSLKREADPSDGLAAHMIDRVLVAADNAMGCVVLAEHNGVTTRFVPNRTATELGGQQLLMLRDRDRTRRDENNGPFRQSDPPGPSRSDLRIEASLVVIGWDWQ
jgi:hypothetical protein